MRGTTHLFANCKDIVSLCPKVRIINTEAKEGKEFTQGHPSSLKVAGPGQANVLTSKPVPLKQFQKIRHNYLALSLPSPSNECWPPPSRNNIFQSISLFIITFASIFTSNMYLSIHRFDRYCSTSSFGFQGWQMKILAHLHLLVPFPSDIIYLNILEKLYSVFTLLWPHKHYSLLNLIVYCD